MCVINIIKLCNIHVPITWDNNYMYVKPQSKYRVLLHVHSGGCGRIKLNVQGLLIQFLFKSMYATNGQWFNGRQWDIFWNV
jgi:hypothetical protein